MKNQTFSQHFRNIFGVSNALNIPFKNQIQVQKTKNLYLGIRKVLTHDEIARRVDKILKNKLP
jgi:hypothetical protein